MIASAWVEKSEQSLSGPLQSYLQEFCASFEFSGNFVGLLVMIVFEVTIGVGIRDKTDPLQPAGFHKPNPFAFAFF